jgi:hypothetical protein
MAGAPARRALLLTSAAHVAPVATSIAVAVRRAAEPTRAS